MSSSPQPVSQNEHKKGRYGTGWLVLALVATLLSICFRIATALSEILVGTVALLLIGALIGPEALGSKSTWISFLAGTRRILLAFRAGALGTISALFGLNHQNHCPLLPLSATVIGSAVVPTGIANAYFMPKHLLPGPGHAGKAREPVPTGDGVK